MSQLQPQEPLGKLDAPTRVKLRSTHILTSLPHIVSELVQNSLDAGASNIEVGVDCEEWMCWVKDNGLGINKDGLSLLGQGSEGGRYGSSKSYDHESLNTLPTFGFRGEALASAADLSCLEISSRTSRSRETWSIILKGGKNLYMGPAVRWRRESSGTVVCIRDAFYNLPVRRLSHPSPSRSFELIRQEIETYALVFPNVTFSLENVHHGDEVSSSKGHSIKIPQTSSCLAAFRGLYGRALTEHIEEIEQCSGNLKLDGFISLSGAHSKGYQFLYVNRHPIARCDLHSMIDSVFSSSSFVKNALDESGETNLPRSNLRRSPRKMEKKPIYVLNITVPPADVDNCLDPAKAHVQFQNKHAIVTLLSSCVRSFLVRRGFLSQNRPDFERSTTDRGFISSRKRQKTVCEGETVSEAELEILDSTQNSYVRRPVKNLALTSSNESSGDIASADSNIDETFIVGPETDSSQPQARTSSWLKENDSECDDVCRRTIPCQAANRDTTNTDQSDVPPWLREALEANQVYEPAEIAIPHLNISSGFQSVSRQLRPSHDLDGSQRRDPFRQVHQCSADITLASVSQRFQKEDLRRARVINQVDRKFIACLLETCLNTSEEFRTNGAEVAEGPVLVLIDQHAADERIRVERFLRDLCLGFMHTRDNGDSSTGGVVLRKLSPPLPVLLTIHEAQRLAESMKIQQTFRDWGFIFEDLSNWSFVLPVENGAGYSQVMVQSVPEIVGDKLLLGDELRDLVKGFLGQLDMEMPPTSAARPFDADEYSDSEFTWLKALRWCPRGLLELINSKACRGAIMFNDTLSISQCESLVQQLSETAFPFQCAHGRPSLVPLTDLGAIVRKDQQLPFEWWNGINPSEGMSWVHLTGRT